MNIEQQYRGGTFSFHSCSPNLTFQNLFSIKGLPLSSCFNFRLHDHLMSICMLFKNATVNVPFTVRHKTRINEISKQLYFSSPILTTFDTRLNGSSRIQ